jgi:GDP-L-fucose synthase
MEKGERIFVAGGGMIGQALLRRLRENGFTALLSEGTAGLELADQGAVLEFFTKERPAYVLLTSVKVGGILANSNFPADFIYTNIQSQTNVIHAAWRSGVKKLLFLGSSCIYPRECPQPMKEAYLLTGRLEPTSEPYAIAKIAGIRMCQSYRRQYGADFIVAVPADVYGPGDDFDPETGHVLPALLSRMHHAKMKNEPEVTIWGTGAPRREALHVDDLAAACLFLMERYSELEMINVGGGRDTAISEMAQAVKEATGYRGKIIYDKSRPDGMPRKLLDSSRLEKLGWRPSIGLTEGIKQTYHWYKENLAK